MKKRAVATVLIIAMLFTAIFTVVGCNRIRNLELSYDDESGLLTWTVDWKVSTYTLKIYDAYGNLILNEPITKETREYPLELRAGVYKAELTAYGSGSIVVVKEIELVVNGTPYSGDEELDDTYDVPPTSAIDDPVKILSNTYYYLKSDDGDLSIGLVNTSGVKDVVAFGMIGGTSWEYNAKKNALLLKPSYLHRFSSGAVLNVDVTYNDGNEDVFDVQIVDIMPLQVIGGEDGLLDVKITSTTLNYKIFLGYDGAVLKEASYSIVKAVCIDGKKRASTDYLTSSSQATVSLYYTRVLSTLKAGLHFVEIYTEYGRSEVWINVINGKENIPCDVSVDFDSSYPDVYVTWDICNEPDYYIVDIAGEEYSSEDYPQLFDGHSFYATGKIAVGNAVTVKAVFDGVANYNSSSKATLSVNVGSTFLSNYLSYDNGFEFLGTKYNYYINDFDEFFDMIYYSLLHYNELEASSVAGYEKRIVFYPNAKAIISVDTSLKQVVSSLNEAVKYSASSRGLENSGVFELNLKVESTFIPNEREAIDMPIDQTKYQDTHYSATGRASNYEGFAVNSYEQEASVRYSEELYLAIERGVRPVPVEGTEAYDIYEKAKSALRLIIDDTMTDYQKVHAIYDWLGANVVYDWDINNKMAGIATTSPEYNKFYAYRQFYLEGVFIDGMAVCNGIAKAMSLMCGIEGIECYKIKGTSSGGAHAWNKVNVDGHWYVVDTTWANRKYSLNSTTSSQRETLSHYTLFMSESTSGNVKGGAHYESYTGRYTNCYAGSDYNVFANTFFTYGSNIYDYVIDSEEELLILIEYYRTTYKDSQALLNQFIAVDVKCHLNKLTIFLARIHVSGVTLYDYNGAMSGVSTIIITKE